MRILVVGLGEVGKPLYEVAKGVYEQTEWLDIEQKGVQAEPDFMHIAFPENDNASFCQSVVGYVQRYRPRHTIIESTVTPGTTRRIYGLLNRSHPLCHSPVRGNLAEGMKKGILNYTKYVGAFEVTTADAVKSYYESLGMKVKVVGGPEETELGKIFETTYRGLMMTWFQEMLRICNAFDADFDEIVEFVGSTEREGKQARPIFHPGVVGGHCIIQNAEKLRSVYDSKFVEALLDSNMRRRKELGDSDRPSL